MQFGHPLLHATFAALALSLCSPAAAQTRVELAAWDPGQTSQMSQELTLASLPFREVRASAFAERQRQDVAPDRSPGPGLFSVLPGNGSDEPFTFHVPSTEAPVYRGEDARPPILHHLPRFKDAPVDGAPVDGTPVDGTPLQPGEIRGAAPAFAGLTEELEAGPFKFGDAREGSGQDNSFLIGCGLGLVSHVMLCLLARPTGSGTPGNPRRLGGLTGSLHLSGGWSHERPHRPAGNHFGSGGYGRAGASQRRR